MGTIKTTNIEPIADNGTVTLGSSGDQFTLATGAKSSFLYPAFEAYLDNGTTPSNDVTTLVTFDVEKFDTASAYNTSTGKFQPQVAGKYFIYGSIGGLSNTNNGNLLKTATMIYLNGSIYRVADFFGESNQGVLHKRMSMPIASILTLNGSSDYVQLYGNIQTYTGGDVNIDAGDDKTFFGAYRIGS